MIYAENILLCIAIPLAVSLLFIRGEVRRYLAAFLLGMGVCLISAYISGFLNLATGMGDNDTSVFLSPVVEELMKLLPLLFFLFLFSPRERTLTTLAVAVGAGFATFENCCYILTQGAESLPYILIRGMAVGVMHIVSVLALSIWLI
ncbi:MAG: PrsW family intramembrane metalloprotease, partial [Clostridia bacterium]|nr:PrsW family intramembrane metalloprotease [Clostridia bacterium]